jgi:predicted metal-dependent hydrolase
MKINLKLDSHNILIDDIKRSKRKSMSISINYDLKIQIKAPYWVTNKEIEAFVIQSKKWIQNKIGYLSTKPKPKSKSFLNGDKYLFLGKEYTLKFSLGTEFILTEEGELLVPTLFSNDTKSAIIDWYKKQAEKIIKERCEFIAQSTGVKPNKIKINNAKTRWGSCTRRGNLCFTWKLIMAPLFVVDYVVLHELIHFFHHNHSKNYWAMVQKFMPNYHEAEDWLKNNQRYTEL